MSGDRGRIFERIRAALPPPADRHPRPKYHDAEAVSLRAPAPSAADPLATFCERLASVNGRSFTDMAALAAWLSEKGATRGYCDRSLLSELGPVFARGIACETALDRGRIDDYRFGITRAAGAIAETGTIVLDDATTSTRLAALAPWIHVAVVRRGTVHRTVADAIRALGADPNVVWCTGPSKTADVEGILIEGVHGPGEQIALIVP